MALTWAGFMRRREFIAGLTAAVAVAPVGLARAQTRNPAPLKRIALVHPTEKPAGMTIDGRRTFKAFFTELRRLSYVEDSNVIIDRFSGLGHSNQSDDLVAEVLAVKPDVIVALSGSLALRFKQKTATVPIVAPSSDPVAIGLVASMARPGGNVTGASVDGGFDLWGKRVQLLSEIAGGRVTNVRFLLAAPVDWWEKSSAHIQADARRAGISIAPMWLDQRIDRAAYERAYATMMSDGVNGVVLFDSAEHITNRKLIVDLAVEHRLPAIYPYREFVEVGGLLSYGVDLADVLRRLADITDKILKGARPGDIPINQQVKFELVLNKATAIAEGMTPPATLIAAADEIIE
ncbi:hypothetical protein EI171_09375 [Bradyrhizobium sp. LCT2]|uniref:ABC transporter substrate-binding protein n=1 Tax=Bradyrhizobium sp. LCT2 TaxID=2493093 RepID=UPI001373D954|nr:ABC transporter substrate-binding protein [Bradyrhizobium sp. LCT2]QHP67625.1 hypothetical protein EI171_09375 [Bradyrhizobium sp. LCT2]